MEYKPRIVIAEDEVIIAADIKRILNSNGYDTIAIATSALEIIQKVDAEKPDLILMDIMLGGYLDGIEAAKIISYKYNTPIIFITASKDEDTLKRANVPESYQFITKPFREDELKSAIEKTLTKAGIK